MAAGTGDPALRSPLGPYSARIEILDPFSDWSVGASYGWQNHPNTGCFFLWALDTEVYPYSTEKLKANDTYE